MAESIAIATMTPALSWCDLIEWGAEEGRCIVSLRDKMGTIWRGGGGLVRMA